MRTGCLELLMSVLIAGLLSGCEPACSGVPPKEPDNQGKAAPGRAGPAVSIVKVPPAKHLPPAFTDSKDSQFIWDYSTDSDVDPDPYAAIRPVAPTAEADEIYISASPAAGFVGCPLGDTDGDCRSDTLPVTVMLLDESGKPVPDQPVYLRIHHCSGKLILDGKAAETFTARTGPDGSVKLDILLGPVIQCHGCYSTDIYMSQADTYPYIVGVNTVSAMIRRPGNKGLSAASLEVIAFPGAPRHIELQ